MPETVQLPAAAASGQIVTEPGPAAGSSTTTAAQVGAVQWNDNHTEIRVYHPNQEYEVQEYCWAGNDPWTPGVTLVGSALTSRVAAGHWVKDKRTHLRVYYQDTNNNIVEKCYDNPDWTNGHTFSGALPGTGIAALAQVSDINGGLRLRVYYQDSRDLIVEKIWDDQWKEWVQGQTFYSAVAGTSIAAVYFTDKDSYTHLRLYYQDSNNYIIEHCFDEGEGGNGWIQGHIFPGALPFTGIAAAHWWNATNKLNQSSHLRLYYQNAQNTIVEQCYDTPFWTKGHTFTGVTPNTGIGAVWWHDHSSHLRVYYEDTSSTLIEQCYDDGTWTTGEFSVPVN